MTNAKGGYSVANAKEFGWGSIGDNLNPARLEMLNQHVVGKRVLDAGCGGGGYVRHLSERGHDAVGIDYHEQFLTLGQNEKSKYVLMQGDIVAGLPFPDKEFDTVICMDVLEHVDDVVAIKELARVAKKRLILTVPREASWLNQYGLVFATYRDTTHLRYYTDESLKALIANIETKSIAILGEQVIPLRKLAIERVKPRSKYQLLEKIYGKLFRKLASRADEAVVYMNIGAVIDL